MKLYILHIITLLIINLSFVNLAISQNFKVIVNRENNIEEISKKELSNIFLKKTTKWSNGEKIVAVNLQVNSETRLHFTKEIHEKSIAQIRAYCQQSVFSGKAAPPIEKQSDKEMIQFIKSNKSAVGYISVDYYDKDIKEIKVNDK